MPVIVLKNLTFLSLQVPRTVRCDTEFQNYCRNPYGSSPLVFVSLLPLLHPDFQRHYLCQYISFFHSSLPPTFIHFVRVSSFNITHSVCFFNPFYAHCAPFFHSMTLSKKSESSPGISLFSIKKDSIQISDQIFFCNRYISQNT